MRFDNTSKATDDDQTSPRRWLRRTGVAALSAALLAGAAPAATAGAASTQPVKAASAAAVPVVTLGTLECATSEDAWGDEAYIQVNGQTVWTAKDSIDDGGKREVNIKAPIGAKVSLYDEDFPDPDDFIGEDTIEGTHGTLVFNSGENDAYYTLSYH